jgi:hypothetical protein
MVKQVFSVYHVRKFTGGSWNSVYNFGRIGAVHPYVKIKNKWIQCDNKIFHEKVYSSQNLPCLKEGWECTNPMRPITLKALQY